MIVRVHHRQSSEEGVRRGSGGGAGGKDGDEDLADFGHNNLSFGEFCSDRNNEDGGSSWRYIKASQRKQRLYQNSCTQSCKTKLDGTNVCLQVLRGLVGSTEEPSLPTN